MGTRQVTAYDQVPELWPGCTAVCLATGPSLTDEQVRYVTTFRRNGHVKIFGCNDVYRITEDLDVLYACDPQWWRMNTLAVEHPCEQKWTQDARAAREFNLKLVQGTSGPDLCYEPSKIHFGSNSGYQLINLAWHFGARKFILLGYNMDVPKGMQQHFFGPHPEGLNRTNNYKSFVRAYYTIKRSVSQNIINCTYPTAIFCFKQMPLEEALPTSLLKETHETDEPERHTSLDTEINSQSVQGAAQEPT